MSFHCRLTKNYLHSLAACQQRCLAPSATGIPHLSTGLCAPAPVAQAMHPSLACVVALVLRSFAHDWPFSFRLPWGDCWLFGPCHTKCRNVAQDCSNVMFFCMLQGFCVARPLTSCRVLVCSFHVWFAGVGVTWVIGSAGRG